MILNMKFPALARELHRLRFIMIIDHHWHGTDITEMPNENF